MFSRNKRTRKSVCSLNDELRPMPFFLGLTEAIEGLKEKCKVFLGDEKKLARAIDTGKSPLLIG